MSPSPQTHPPTIALVDTRWAGHHPTYLREFTASLLRIGARVLLLCQHPDEILSSLNEFPEQTIRDRTHGLRLLLRNHGLIDRRRDHDPLSTLLRWHATGHAVRAAESASGWKADLVFFCYLDSYLRFAPFPRLPQLLLGRPWSGLYFRNAHLGGPAGHQTAGRLRRAAKGDPLLASPTCRAVCVLDERFNPLLAKLSGHPVIPFPDMTDETPPVDPTPQAQAIVRQAAGRRIIGLISMERRKGLLTLLRCALRASELREPWFFVATGPFLRQTFNPQELAFCEEVARRIAEGTLDNLHFDTSGARIQDGAPYNSIFNTFDLVWAAYEGFEGSSNALTKAAAFHKPVIATRGECIGHRVEHYQLGNTFAEGNVDAALDAIRATLAGTRPDGQSLSLRFADYHRLHCRAYLDEIFSGLLNRPAINTQDARESARMTAPPA